MLYLESPAGVGFSYSKDSSSYEGVNDSITARDNLMFMKRWFDKFPQYRNRNFFIAGESYAAGHYAPQLAKLMRDYNHKEKLFNLKGLAVGSIVASHVNEIATACFWNLAFGGYLIFKCKVRGSLFHLVGAISVTTIHLWARLTIFREGGIGVQDDWPLY